LHREVFGPSTILIRCDSQAELEQVARSLEGSLTATLHGTERDLRAQPLLLKILTGKAGRIIFNGYPTGVEVCAAMQHGGPYPSTTDPRFTSVGTAAIVRFARPICYQDFPSEFLPPELR
jgi:alpha-ketoglutaric semialdehyde dehydrogenase